MFIQIGVNFLLNSAMERLWLMVNGLQLIVAIPLIPVKYPANAATLLGSLIDIANFDLVPVDLIYPYIYDFDESEAFNYEFEQAGYESGYLAENMGTVFVFAHFFALFYVITAIAYVLRNKSKRMNKFYVYLRHKLLWNAVIIFLMEGYIEIGLSSISLIKTWNWDPNGDVNHKSNYVYAIIFLAIIVIFPVALVSLYYKHRKELDHKHFRHRFGGPFAGLQKRHKYRLMFYVFQYLSRRLAFVSFLIAYDDSILLSIFAVLLTTEVSLAWLLMYQPFETQFRNRIEVFNEVILFLILFMTFCFADVMTPEGAETVGYYLIALICFYLLLHIYSLASDSLSKVCYLIWLQLAKCRYGKVLQKRIRRQAKRLIRRETMVKRPPPIVVEDTESE